MEYQASTFEYGYRILDQYPETAEEIDIDRLVWDPGYREAAKALLTGMSDAGIAE